MFFSEIKWQKAWDSTHDILLVGRETVEKVQFNAQNCKSTVIVWECVSIGNNDGAKTELIQHHLKTICAIKPILFAGWVRHVLLLQQQQQKHFQRPGWKSVVNRLFSMLNKFNRQCDRKSNKQGKHECVMGNLWEMII